MANKDQFYLMLLFSASMKLHPENKISDYTTELLKTIYLERNNYKVGLSEKILDTDIENAPDKKLAFTIYRTVKNVKEDIKNLPTSYDGMAVIDNIEPLHIP